MKLIGPLMIEHRLIERMLALIQKEAQKAADEQQIDAAFIERAADFIRWYADKTHHGKEEAILFREVAKKDLSEEHRALLKELLEDHDFGRRTVGQILEAREKYLQGSREAFAVLLQKLGTLVDFYHEHIRKEDKIFFPACMNYLSEQEKEPLLQEFRESDRNMIHARYGAVVEQYEKIMLQP
jgi:hemerythrin-like domain-containing protein